MFASRAAAMPAPSADRAIMSLGVDAADVDQGAAALQARGLKPASGPGQAGPVRTRAHLFSKLHIVARACMSVHTIQAVCIGG